MRMIRQHAVDSWTLLSYAVGDNTLRRQTRSYEFTIIIEPDLQSGWSVGSSVVGDS
jgi:hypothetical protein